MKQAFLYSSKIWLTTIFAGPYLTGIVLIVTDPLVYSVKDLFSIGEIYVILVGLFVALPSWALSAMIVRFLSAIFISNRLTKLCLSVAAFVLVLLPWAIVDSNSVFHSNYWPSLLPWVLTYYVIIVAGIWFYDMKIKPNSVGDSKN